MTDLEQGDLALIEGSNRWAARPDPRIDVQRHPIDVIPALDVLREPDTRGIAGPNEGQPDLSAVGMPADGQIHSAAPQRRNRLRRMGEQQPEGLRARTGQCGI